MSFHKWSKFELVHRRQHEKTDHWSKLHCNARSKRTLHWEREKISNQETFATPHRTLTSAPHHNLKSSPPSPNMLVHPSSSSHFTPCHGREQGPSVYSQRAKLGYKYWLDDLYNMISPRKNVTLGAQGSFLGIGVPRL